MKSTILIAVLLLSCLTLFSCTGTARNGLSNIDRYTLIVSKLSQKGFDVFNLDTAFSYTQITNYENRNHTPIDSANVKSRSFDVNIEIIYKGFHYQIAKLCVEQWVCLNDTCAQFSAESLKNQLKSYLEFKKYTSGYKTGNQIPEAKVECIKIGDTLFLYYATSKQSLSSSNVMKIVTNAFLANDPTTIEIALSELHKSVLNYFYIFMIQNRMPRFGKLFLDGPWDTMDSGERYTFDNIISEYRKDLNLSGDSLIDSSLLNSLNIPIKPKKFEAK